jgi:hypothetical protein
MIQEGLLTKITKLVTNSIRVDKATSIYEKNQFVLGLKA